MSSPSELPSQVPTYFRDRKLAVWRIVHHEEGWTATTAGYAVKQGLTLEVQGATYAETLKAIAEASAVSSRKVSMDDDPWMTIGAGTLGAAVALALPSRSVWSVVAASASSALLARIFTQYGTKATVIT